MTLQTTFGWPQAFAVLIILTVVIGWLALAALNSFGPYVGGRHADPIGEPVIDKLAALSSLKLPDRLPHLAMSPHNMTSWETVPVGDGVVLQPYPRRTKVLIYGAGLGKDEAEPMLNSDEWLVWGLNLVAPFDREGRLRADVWWDIHQRTAQNETDLRWIATCPVPIYVPEDLQDASQNAIRYPLQALETEFGVNYWACTFAYQLALALHMGMTDIGLFGVELAHGTSRERTVEWACVSYWLGRAMERGVRLHTPERTTLRCHPGRYGFEYRQELEAVEAYTDDLTTVDAMRRLYRNKAGMGG